MTALPLFGKQGAGGGTVPGGTDLRLAPHGAAPHSPLPGVAVRSAALADVPRLEALMAPYVATGDLLPRSNYDLCRHIKEYAVAEAPNGEIVGCGSLKIYSRGLGEVAGLAVQPEWQGTGVGRTLLDTLIAEARAQGLREVLALTRKPAFFLKLGFAPAEREQFPLKVWADCARCPRQNCCDEVAVVLRL
ncbi:MAG TPA: GNAT family N-acetyltransferase [Gemmatimonadales bacterium]|nr:GNAT family N-acetyltransferase [Gemmatimonadales bacterium]